MMSYTSPDHNVRMVSVAVPEQDCHNDLVWCVARCNRMDDIES